MFERLCLVVLAGIVTVLSGLSVAGHGPFAGRVLFAITYNHGVDSGDLFVVMLWVGAMALLAVLWRRT